ncbi:unnamed protein product, partial [Hapterophycus canaliculatus]
GRGGGRAWNAVRLERAPDVDKNGLVKLPRDNLATMADEVMSVGDIHTNVVEEARLRPSYVPPLPTAQEPAGAGTGTSAAASRAQWESQGRNARVGTGAAATSAAAGRQDQPWFTRNVVDHRWA